MTFQEQEKRTRHQNDFKRMVFSFISLPGLENHVTRTIFNGFSQRKEAGPEPLLVMIIHGTVGKIIDNPLLFLSFFLLKLFPFLLQVVGDQRSREKSFHFPDHRIFFRNSLGIFSTFEAVLEILFVTVEKLIFSM